jgi:hypothetical protein
LRATTSPSLRSSAARPSSPSNGFSALTWNPAAMSSAVTSASRAASARKGCVGSDEKSPASNILRLATPSPSDREKASPVAASWKRQEAPAPASKSTLTMARS